MPNSKVARLIPFMATKSCKQDAIPTSILKQVTPNIIETIIKIVNISFAWGTFAEEWKMTIVYPPLKKLGSELIPSNYRPVSNFPFLSKFLEKCALQQFNNDCNTNKLLPDYQLAYRTNYSTETSLVKLINDILWTMEWQEVATLTALDLSPAFETWSWNTHRWARAPIWSNRFCIKLVQNLSVS